VSVGVETGTIQREAGIQSLLPLPSMSTGISELPAEACQNLLIVSPWAPSRVENALRERGVSLSGCGLIPISSSPVRYDGPLWTTDPVAPSDLTGLSIRYSQAMRHVEPGEGWVLIDNAQVLLMYAETKRVCRLLDRLTAQAKERNVNGVLAVDHEAVQDGTLSKLQTTVDRRIDS
jgi:hypothetical protein